MIQRNVYEVLVVKSTDGKILKDEKIVATSSEAALTKIDLMKTCTEQGCSVDDIEFVILKLGSLRAVQEVVNTSVPKF